MKSFVKKMLNQKQEEEKEEKKPSPSEDLDCTEVTIAINKEDTLMNILKKSEQSPASLVLLNGPKDLIGHIWILDKEVSSVGRSRKMNEIYIPQDNLSKVHFKIVRKKNQFYVVDMKSTNKTLLNKKVLVPYEENPLENNHYIQASSLIFKFLAQGNIETFSSKNILDKSYIDALTEAGNRRFLEVEGANYFLSHKQLSLIVFDVDDFKFINDTYGHSAGDYVLQHLSLQIRKTLRDQDLFIRYGGDEFCIFTPNPLPIAQNMIERIKQKIKEETPMYKNKKIEVNISVGLSEKKKTDKTWEDIYYRADQESYENKRNKKKQAG